MAWLRLKAMRCRQAPWGRSQGLARGIGSPSREPACQPLCGLVAGDMGEADNRTSGQPPTGLSSEPGMSTSSWAVGLY